MGKKREGSTKPTLRTMISPGTSYTSQGPAPLLSRAKPTPCSSGGLSLGALEAFGGEIP